MTKVATPKKTVVKKVAKKTVSKKTTAVAKPVLVYAEDAHSFWVADGQILNSLMALSDAVGKMDKKTFVHHVEKNKNDFAVWVDTVLGDKDCALDLGKVQTLTATRTVLAKHLKKYAQ